MRGILVCLLVWVAAGQGLAQPVVDWSKTYSTGDNHEWFNAAVCTWDWGWGFAGFSSDGAGSHTEGGYLLVRTDSAGDTLWTRRYRRSTADICRGMTPTMDGGFAMVGWSGTSQYVDGVIWLLRVDRNGDSLWSRTFRAGNFNIGYSVTLTPDGGFFIGGACGTYDAGNSDFYAIRTDSLGDTLWTRVYGGSDWDECTSVCAVDSSGFLMAGTTYSDGSGNQDFALMRLTAAGDSVWFQTYGGPGWEWCSAMMPLPGGGCAMAGGTTSYGAGGNDSWLVRTNAEGAMLWNRTFGGERDDWGYALSMMWDGHLLLGGYTLSSSSGLTPRYWLVKVGLNGWNGWTYAFPNGANAIDHCYAVTAAIDSGIILAGMHRDDQDALTRGYVIKTLPEHRSAVDGRPEVPACAGLRIYPNPFNLNATIEFSLAHPGLVTVTRCDILGREAVIAQEHFAAGTHMIPWSCAECASGIYYITLRGNGTPQTQKTVLLK
jgi:hypothetical protein